MRSLFLSLVLLCVASVSPAHAQQCVRPSILLSIDKSYSMMYDIPGDENKWEAAKKAISAVANDHHEAAAFGVQVFPRAPRTCDNGAITLGIGLNQLRKIPCDAEFRMDPAALAGRIPA